MKFGLHWPNYNVDETEFQRIMQLGASSYVLLHYQANILPRLRLHQSAAPLLVRYYDKSLLTKPPASYAQAVANEASHWQSYTSHWVFANELNRSDEAGYGWDSPSLVAHWCASVAEALHTLCPWMIVHMPALAPVGNWWEYYQELMRYDDFDVIDLHCYGSLPEMQDVVLAAMSQSSKPFFISELNGSGTLEFFNWASSKPRIQAACYFIWKWLSPDLPDWQLDLKDSELESQLKGETMPITKPKYAQIGNLQVLDLRDALPDEPGKMLPVEFTEKDFISIHHTVTPANTLAKTIYDYHKAQGWGGIGYNFLVRQDGLIEYVGECNTERAAIGANPQANRRGIHIAMVWDTSKADPTEEMLLSVKVLIANIQQAYGWWLPVVPHRLFNSNSKWDTSCPVGWRGWWSKILRAVGD